MSIPQEFLISEFKTRKARNPNFSMRAFAKWLGISPAQLSQMLAGKRPITFKLMNAMSERLGISPIEKKALFDSLLKDKDFVEGAIEKKVLRLQEDQFRLISDWYHLAILSLTKMPEAKPDPRWISRRLGITVEQAHEAVLRLVRLGVVELKPIFRQICDPIEVVSQIPSQAIRNYHKQNLNLAIEKIDTVSLDHRQFQAMTLAVSPNNIEAYKKLIDDFLEQASQLSEKRQGTEVYNLNVQLYPVTTISEEKK